MKFSNFKVRNSLKIGKKKKSSAIDISSCVDPSFQTKKIGKLSNPKKSVIFQKWVKKIPNQTLNFHFNSFRDSQI